MGFDLQDSTTSVEGCNGLECSRTRRLDRQRRLPWCHSQSRPSQRRKLLVASPLMALEVGAIR